MNEITPVILYPQVTRKGLNELLNLPDGFKQAVTHIGLGTAKYTPTAEQTAARGEVLRVPVVDSIESGANAVQFFAIAAGWMGALTAVYEIIFYLESGTPLAIYSNPTEAEAVLLANRSEELYYTLVLDVVPTDKLQIINTQRVFNPGLLEYMVASLSSQVGIGNLYMQSVIDSERQAAELVAERTQWMQNMDAERNQRISDVTRLTNVQDAHELAQQQVNLNFLMHLTVVSRELMINVQKLESL